MNWYYAENGKQVGPLSDSEWEQTVRSGRIQPDTLVWHEGLPNWKPYRELLDPPALTASGPGGSLVQCSECGNAFPPEETVRYGTLAVCTQCKPGFLQRLHERPELSGEMAYAGFWIRLVAKIIDGLILGVPLGILFLVLFFPMIQSGGTLTTEQSIIIQLVAYAVGAAYNTFFVGRFGATPGKMVLKLEVVTSDGGSVSYARACGRYFAEILSGLVCYLGYIIAAFDEQKRTLHDHICNTRVIRR